MIIASSFKFHGIVHYTCVDKKIILNTHQWDAGSWSLLPTNNR